MNEPDQATGRRIGRRRWPAVLALIAFIILGGIVIGLLVPRPRPNAYLDPASGASDGGQALADLLGERGFQVIPVYGADQAISAVRSAASADRTGTPATLVITRPELLTQSDLTRLSQADADLFVIGAGSAALSVLAPAMTVASMDAQSTRPVPPTCPLPAAQLAGTADLSGITYQVPGDVDGCYPIQGYPALGRYEVASRMVTIVGTGSLFSNSLLADNGNAALALNLLNGAHRIVWLTPETAAASGWAGGAGGAGGGGSAGPSLIPWAAQLVLIQLGVALLLVVIWRSRRFGPLILERLPVVVRASETVEGHARLYQSRRARGRAASALREAMLDRLLPALEFAKDAPADAVTDAIASRSSLSRPEIEAIVYGPAPASDADLVRLAQNLDHLERQVRGQ